MDLDQLAATALLKVYPAYPPLPAQIAGELTTALDKLFVQFAREGRCLCGGAQVVTDGAFVLVAWEGHDLSGCSYDKIAKILGRYAESGHDLLTPPPLIIDRGRGVEWCSHGDFRAAVASGRVSDDAYAWDTMAQTLGEWRQGACRPLSQHWIYPLYQRALAQAGGAAS
ncbi:MAG: hypothetical protein EA401_07865 [Planctomycetota bacterium]|nr:MAG: hypothetical protein EA401_07865 [Planctomycetota bacterium]